MGVASEHRVGADSTSETAALEHLRKALLDGGDWPTPLLEAAALWTSPRESVNGRVYDYFIAGEAFDWLLLAERLCTAFSELISQQETEELLFHGRFPPSFDASKFRDLLGVEKYRGHLNYYYGVTVEEGLQLATELEVLKRYASNGLRSKDNCTEEAFARIYRAPQSELLSKFREEKGYEVERTMSLGESKEFTYWLFKYRMYVSDKAKIASDTHKGIEQLQRMGESAHVSGHSPGTA